MTKYKITLSDGSQRVVEADGYDQWDSRTFFYNKSEYTSQWNTRHGIWPFRYTVPMSRVAFRTEPFLTFCNHSVNSVEVLT